MESLKELNVLTFGKRFKIHTALTILRDECGYQSANPINRMSLTSSTYSDDLRSHQRHHSPISPTVSRHGLGNNRQSVSYHSNLMIERHYNRPRNELLSPKKQYEEEEDEEEEEEETETGLLSPDSIKSPLSDVSATVLTPTSNYDIMNTESKNVGQLLFHNNVRVCVCLCMLSLLILFK